jgi:hypothetical protein
MKRKTACQNRCTAGEGDGLVDPTVHADLFQTTKQNISQHIQSIYDEIELTPEVTVKKYLSVRRAGSRDVRRMLAYYNLE